MQERKKKSMAATIIFVGLMVTFAGLMMKVNADRGGIELVKMGLGAGVKFFMSFLLTMVLLSLVAGQVQVYYATAHHQLNALFAGKLGILRAYALGLGLPGSVSAGDGLKRAWIDGTMSKGAILTFLIASSMGNWLRVLFQIPILGPYLTIMVWIIGIVVSACLSAVILIFV